MLEDFLAYVEDHFADLGPTTTLGLARGNAFRARAERAEASGRESRIKWGPTLDLPSRRTYLFHVEDGIELSLYPADALSQARGLLKTPAGCDGTPSAY